MEARRRYRMLSEGTEDRTQVNSFRQMPLIKRILRLTILMYVEFLTRASTYGYLTYSLFQMQSAPSKMTLSDAMRRGET
jgi:hypothetical protein